MAYRKIVDPTSQAWDVWEVIPSRVDDRLTDSPNPDRRRIAPVPPDWERLSDDELLTLLLGAPVVGRPHRLTQ